MPTKPYITDSYELDTCCGLSKKFNSTRSRNAWVKLHSKKCEICSKSKDASVIENTVSIVNPSPQEYVLAQQQLNSGN